MAAFPIVVAAPSLPSAAYRALTAEGLDVELALLPEPTSYGQLLDRLWRTEGFVLVEWDIAPWPGAIQGLRDCEQPLCVHRYHNGAGFGADLDGFGYSLGCTKLAGPLLRERPLDRRIPHTPWYEVDSLLWRHTLAGAPVHVHHPGVAHAKAP